MASSFRSLLMFCALFLSPFAFGQDQPPLKPPFPAPRLWKEYDRRCEVARVSPDGKLVAVVAGKRGRLDKNMVIVYDTATGKERYRFPVLYSTSGARGSVAFTPDGKRIVSFMATSKDRRTVDLHARVADAATGKLIRSFPLREGQYLYRHSNYAVSDKVLVVAGTKEVATVYDLATGKPLGDLPGDQRLNKVALSRDGHRFVGVTEVSTQVHAWDVGKLAYLGKIYERRGAISTVDISPDGATVALFAGKSIRVSDLATGEVKAQCEFVFYATRLRFTADGKTLVASGIGPNHGLVFWDWQTNKEIRGGSLKGAKKVSYMLPPQGEEERKAWRWGEVWDFGMSDDGKTVAFSPADKQSRLELVSPEPPKK